MVSRLEIEKNIDGAIRGFSLIIRENPGLGLVIVGDGSEEGRLKKDVARLKIGPQVAFEGWQSDIISYYKGCDCVLVTSWYEGYGMVYKEAEALNCRIVSTDVGIARDIGAVIVGWEPEEIARGLRRVL
jgi:glycosyltransferase involved in cell wall biosynthesis